MQRLGVQKSVYILRDFVAAAAFTLFWAVVASFTYWGFIFMGKLPVSVILTFAVLYCL